MSIKWCMLLPLGRSLSIDDMPLRSSCVFRRYRELAVARRICAKRGLSIAVPLLVCGKQVRRRAETMGYALMRNRLDEFNAHAAPRHSTACNGATRCDIQRRK